MKKFKKILAGALAVLSIMSISPVYGVKHRSRSRVTSVAQMEERRNKNFQANIGLAYAYYGNSNFRKAVKDYPEVMSSDKIKVIKTLFNNIEEKKALFNPEMEKILKDSFMFDSDTLREVAHAFPGEIISSATLPIPVDDQFDKPQIHLASKMSKELIENIDEMDFGVGSGYKMEVDTEKQIRDKGSDYYYFELCDSIVVLDPMGKIFRAFRLNSVCVISSEYKFLYSFVRGDDDKWYKHDGHNVVPVDDSEVTEMRVEHANYLFSAVRVM